MAAEPSIVEELTERLRQVYMTARGRYDLANARAGRAVVRHFRRLAAWLVETDIPYPDGFARMLAVRRIRPPGAWTDQRLVALYVRELDRWEPMEHAWCRSRRYAMDWLEENGIGPVRDDPLHVWGSTVTVTEMYRSVFRQWVSAAVGARVPVIVGRLSDLPVEELDRLDVAVGWYRLIRRHRIGRGT